MTNEPFEKSSSEAVHREPAIQREREEERERKRERESCRVRLCTESLPYRERGRERERERERELSSEAVHREPAHTETERGRQRNFLYAALSY